MITRLTKIQLIVFAIVTVLGCAFVGGRYAEIDRLFVDRSFPVTAKFTDSGGIFAGAQVTYRGIEVGRVGKLAFTDEGVDVTLEIEKSAPEISADTVAIVANKSAIGEQFVDLQPRTRQAPYLQAGTVIDQSDTRIPLDTTTLLVNLDALVGSVDTQSLKILVDELGAAFEGTGRDLTRIVDTSTEFIDTASDNLDVTRALIRNSGSVLQTQIDKQGELATFSQNLALLSDTLVDADPDLRRLLDEGTSSAKLVRTVVDENASDLQSIFRDLRLTTEPLAKHEKSLQVLSIIYPYTVEGAFSVTAPSKVKGREGKYDATFGLVLEEPSTPVCEPQASPGPGDYRPRRDPDVVEDVQFHPDTDCTDEELKTLVPRSPRKTTINRDRAGAASAGGEDTWKWILLDPAVN